MIDPLSWATVSVASLAGVSVISIAGLKAWRDWIALQRLAFERRPANDGAGSPIPAGRIEVADLRERVRKLEAIAAGVDL